MTDLFNEEQTPNPPVTPSSPTDYNAFLKLIVNEKGEQKYATLDKALEALAHTQSYVPTIKAENETLKAQLADTAAKLRAQEELEETLRRLAESKEPREANPPAVSGLTEEAAARLFEQLQERKEAEKVINSNKEIVQRELSKKFGDKAKDAIAAKAAELGMSTQALGDLAKTAPQAVLQLFNTGAPKGATPTSNSFTTPLSAPPEEEITLEPGKSYLNGSTHRDQVALMQRIRAGVEKKHGITH